MKKSKHWLIKKCYVYIYYDVDGTPIYVGIGRNDRWLAHWKLDTHLGRLLRKRERELGICLYPEFIEADNWEDAQLGEVLYVWCFGRADIYPSRKALIDALGQGKQGKRHPGFRYV